MTSPFAEALASLAPKFEPGPDAMFRIAFALDGRCSFERARQLAVSWLDRKMGRHLSGGARDGKAFEQSMKGWRARGVRAVSERGDRWAALFSQRLDEAGGHRKVEIALERKAEGAELRMRVSQRAGEAGAAVAWPPALAADIVRDGAARADGVALTAAPRVVGEDVDMGAFEDFLFDRSRLLPIVALSNSVEARPAIEPALLGERLAGVAHLFSLDDAASWELTERRGKAWSVYLGAVRIYFHQRFGAEAAAHPFFLPASHAEPEALFRNVIDQLAGRSFDHSRADKNALTFDNVAKEQQEIFERSRGAAVDAPRKVDADKKIDALVDRLSREQEARIAAERERDGAQRDLETANARIETLEEEGRSLREEASRTWRELGRLRARNHQLERGETANGDAAPALEDLADLANWAEVALGDRLVFTPRAMRNAKAGAVAWRSLTARIGEALLWLAGPYRDARRDPEARDRSDAEAAKLRIEVDFVMADLAAARNRPDYWASHGGRRHFMDRHLKYGAGYGPRSMFRIYFFWDEEDQRVVVGEMPGHLDNKRTN